MKNIFTKIILSLYVLGLFAPALPQLSAAEDDPVYTTLRTIDLGTYNEYRYKMTEQFFKLKDHYEVKREMSKSVLQRMAILANDGYKFLPDNLKNKNFLNNLLIDIKKGVDSPRDSAIYTEIVQSLAVYVENVEIQSIYGKISASPNKGNAPFSTTLRAELTDPSGTQILGPNYTWWIDVSGRKVVIGRGPIINYTFKKEGNFSIFLDATSSHKNSEGNVDVLPYREKLQISVQEKVASIIINVNNDRVRDGEELKFTPSDADYGLIFDATSSTPTDGTKFVETFWDFGNGVTRRHSGAPKIERIRYGRQGDFPVTLLMTTNEGKKVESRFMVYVRDPIAKIQVDRQDGYIGDKFTFAAKTSGRYRDLTYSWQIIDIENDKIVYEKSDKVLTYTFQSKGKYNVQLRTRRSNGEVDQDTRIVYVTSQAPIAEFETSKPFSYKPNRVFFDATRSFDPDFSDDGKLKYQWIINGDKVNLEEAKANGSVGYYTFDSVGTQSVTLEVTDPDGIMTVKQGTVDVDSILAVEMFAFPRVIQREGYIKFSAVSPEAEVFEWDFGDGKTRGGSLDKVTHTYEKSGTFEVRLKVTDKDNNTNTYSRTVYVSDSDAPLAVMDISFGALEKPSYNIQSCDAAGAYVVNRAQNISLDAGDSINIDGQESGLEYSWKIGNSKYSTSENVTHRFDELGCFPVKLTVKSKDNGKTHSREVMMDVRNLKPILSSLKVDVTNPTEDPLIINVSAQGAKDPDGVIQSYLWYYYTDTDREPQDFRSTAGDSTTFVIPKVTGNYYFVAILKDNNSEKITSEEATGAKYFQTITGDNINTPIVELGVNDNSTIIGEEVVFTARAQNILGQDISKDAQFSWDFDGDGFYDTQTKEATTTYTYKKSGEFYAKVKVKYRGISSTKNITMNVGNKLVPDFGYISIGNKFVFFDSSAGTIDSRVWDLGDGTKKSGSYFEHTYTDGKVSHDVKLVITEGTKTKEVTKEVTKNIKNILKSRGKSFSLFSYPMLDAEGSITLDSSSEKFFVYLGESAEPASSYVFDYDIENDSDLNGGMDDDEDNKGTASYSAGDVLEIPLNSFRNQILRAYTKDAEGNILGSQDISITKSYIDEVNIDPDMIVFEGVTESEKAKIEKLKDILMKLPQQQKLKSLEYIQKLQENWNDETEKTRTILDFENYIFELGLANENQFIEILESLLVEGQEDQSQKQITYQALVNLVPETIECEVESGTCKDNILSKLADIKDSDDSEYNKALGKEILEVIGATDLMTNEQKLDFKAILASLVYGGNVDDIPEEEKEEVIKDTPSSEGSNAGAILATIGKGILWVLAIFIIIIAGLYVMYLIIGKKQNKTFSEFITRATDLDVKESPESDSSFEDILGEPKEKPQSDILSSPKPQKEEPKKVPSHDDATKKTEEVPDWLKGNFAANETKKEVVPKEEVKTEKRSIDTSKRKDTLIKATETPVKKEVPIKKEPVQKAAVKDEKKDNFDLEKDTKLQEDSNVPDWLKGSFTEDTSTKTEEVDTKKETEPKKEEAQERVKEDKKEVLTEDKKEAPKSHPLPQKETGETKQKVGKMEDDPSVPDWLKGSFTEDTSTKAEKVGAKKEIEQKEVMKEEKKEDAKVDKKEDAKVDKKEEVAPKKTTTRKKKTVTKAASPSSKKTQEQKEEASVVKSESTKDTKKSKDQSEKDEKPSEELWDDGMKIPDWLKADDEK